MLFYLAADHGGFNLKETIKKWLVQNKYPVHDYGPSQLINDDDYPTYVIPAMQDLSRDADGLGIVVCRNGVGVSMLANKFPKIRAALSFDEKHAASSKLDDNTNVLALPADYLSEEKALKIIKTWIETPFSQEERHIRRLNQIEKLQ